MPTKAKDGNGTAVYGPTGKGQIVNILGISPRFSPMVTAQECNQSACEDGQVAHSIPEGDAASAAGVSQFQKFLKLGTLEPGVVAA
jgi:hypothetical protein